MPMKKLMMVVVSALYAAVFAMSAEAANITVSSVAGLKAALADAVPNDIIELAAGTYDIGSDQILMEGLEGVTVRGVSGGKTVITSTAEGDQPAVLTLKGCTGCTIADFRFVDCAQITSAGRVFGGAVDVEGCKDVSILRCDFRKCFAFNGGNATVFGAYGGAIGIAYSTNVVVDRCRVVGCEVQSLQGSGKVANQGTGGGIAFYEASGAILNTAVVGCFSGNLGAYQTQKADDMGPGGIMVYSLYTANMPENDPRVAISNCLVAGSSVNNAIWGVGNRPARHGVDLYGFPGYAENSDETRVGGEGAGVRGRAMDISNCTFAYNNGTAVRFTDDDSTAKARSNNTHINNLYWDNRGTYGRFNGNGTFKDSGTVTDVDPQFERDGRPTVSLTSGYEPLGAWAGADLFVDVVTGDDTNEGTVDKPFKTITAALAKAADGAVITVAAGNYTAESGETFPLDLDAKFGITLKGAGAEQTILDVAEADDTRVMSVVGSAFVRVEGFTLKGARLVVKESGGVRSGAGANVANAGAITFAKCVFTDNQIDAVPGGSYTKNQGLGISFVSVRHGAAEDCVFTNLSAAANGVSCQSHGGVISVVKATADLDRCIIRDNVSAASSSGGGGACLGAVCLFGYWTGDDSHVRNCLIANNRMVNGQPNHTSRTQYFANGITMARGEIVNCTIVSNVDYTAKGELNYGDGLFRYTLASVPAATVAVSNTVVLGHYRDICTTGTAPVADYNAYANSPDITAGANDVPLAADAWPFRRGMKRAYQLPPGSPLIDKGANLDWTKEDVDLAGNSRLVGESVDIGAYEYYQPGLMLFVR